MRFLSSFLVVSPVAAGFGNLSAIARHNAAESTAHSPDDLAKEARRLRAKARLLRQEAVEAERSLKIYRQNAKDLSDQDADSWIDLLLGNSKTTMAVQVDGGEPAPISIETLAMRIKANNLYSFNKIQKLCRRLYDRETDSMPGSGVLLKDRAEFKLGDENNSVEKKENDSRRIAGLLDRILEAIQSLDDQCNANVASDVRSSIKDLRLSRDALIKRRFESLAAGKEQVSTLDDLVEGSIGKENGKSEAELQKQIAFRRIIDMPLWVPPSLSVLIAKAPTELSVSCLERVKTELLPDSGFFCTSWDYCSTAAVFRGRISLSNETDLIFNGIQSRLQTHPGLRDKVQLFLAEDNEWTGPSSFEDSSKPPGVIIAVPREVIPEHERIRGKTLVAALSVVLTCFTSFVFSLSAYALNGEFFRNVERNDVSAVVPTCLPLALGVLAVSAIHECSHILAARVHKVEMGCPVPLPSLETGTFGSITPLRSFPSDRKAMFDIAISGPLVATLVSFLLIVSGLDLTVTASAQELERFPVISAALVKSSYLVGAAASFISPKLMLLPNAQPFPVHPLFLVGWSGLVSQALNILPIGRLDGGRAAMAVFGRKVSASISFFSILTLVIISFVRSSSLIFFWTAIVATFQRLADLATVDDFSPVDKTRKNIYLILLSVAVLTLWPFPI
ncbi:hypothetical protein THAOC_03166 [Thalassiosira oceanica]|uniref:Peptidase M50 domain-containing protein n=1 Tax=Thalassiosira oceanica TaxID=159749 RepID=K0T8T0_THAOC|nr:hypothetical protein THAOC_03166 [Thalassiosira oceanica]|mmetsp:Transcript_19413/g.43782  ORF Transcript_19413/g.43782 Transcript_19413/m.43782 type:complete len:676 (-) Transcript_19413:47-2074(-)|eukprot:EJK75123.1 hypothetical protein THAOC_03166 [Thalassiosira oceanica]